MSKFQIFKQSDAQSAAAEAGENLNASLAENKKLPVLLLLSGGSCLSIIDYVGQTALGANLTVTMLDERFSQDPEINNFAQLQKTDFYKDAFDAEASFFGTLPRPGETIEQLRTRWDKNLKSWRAENPGGLIMATLGMGADGHTAGILPFPEDPLKFDKLFNGNEWTAAYNAGDKNKYPERVTTTLTFLKNIDLGFALVCGKEKATKFNQLLSAADVTANLPAAIWHKMKKVKIFTDL
jgi:6-phosphogluconolactonase/glucosamine-6-phosphate isomerase/deaminase